MKVINVWKNNGKNWIKVSKLKLLFYKIMHILKF
jgi:hypothetical protein